MGINMKSNNSTDLSLRSFLKDLITEVFHIDSRIIKTLLALLTKPGYLTLAYLKSSNEKFIPPLKLYFIINFIFFLLIPILNTPQFQIFSFSLKSLSGSNQTYQNIINEQIKAKDLSKEIYEERFNANLKYNQPAFVFLIIPLFALVLNITNLKNNRHYLEHLFLSVHFLSFFLIILLIAIFLYRTLKFVLNYLSISSGYVALIIIIALFMCLSVYLFLALRTYYENGILSSILKLPVLLTGLFLAIGVYTQFLFFYTIIALKWGY